MAAHGAQLSKIQRRTGTTFDATVEITGQFNTTIDIFLPESED